LRISKEEKSMKESDTITAFQEYLDSEPQGGLIGTAIRKLAELSDSVSTAQTARQPQPLGGWGGWAWS
jgi:hypothetical protein